MSKLFKTTCALTFCLAASGCLWGPKSLQHSRTHYNKAVQTTARQEMLLNLVRMKYRESVEFVSIPSITAQHSYTAGTGLSWGFGGGPATQTYGLNAGAQSRPTIVYRPEQAQEFNRRLIAPMSLETLRLLSSKGWAISRVLRLTVRNINDLDNATSAGGPTPGLKPDFEEFLIFANRWRALQAQSHGLEVAYEKLVVDDPTQMSDPIDSRFVNGEDVVLAAEKGFKFRRNRNGTLTLWTRPKPTRELVLRVAPDVRTTDGWQTIVELLELDPRLDSYRLRTDSLGQLSVPGKWRTGEDRNTAMRKELILSTRSLKEMMFYLSHAVTVPQRHVDEGLITITYDYSGKEFDWRQMSGDLLDIHFSRLPPRNAVVSVRYKGHWFYIDDRDLNSKSTFNLLIELFNLEIRAGGGAQIPLLSI